MPMINPSAKVPLGQHLLQLLRLKTLPPMQLEGLPVLHFRAGLHIKDLCGGQGSMIPLSKAMEIQLRMGQPTP